MSKHEVGFYDTFGFNDALFNEFLYPIMKDVGGKKMFKCDIKEKKDKYANRNVFNAHRTYPRNFKQCNRTNRNWPCNKQV